MATNLPSAHAKVILFGEHAVVHGRLGLAASIEGALIATKVAPLPEEVLFEVPTWNLWASTSSPGILGKALKLISSLVPHKGGLFLRAEAKVPMSAGLGSSAASAALLVRALAQVRGASLDDTCVRAIVHEAETLFHGRPSGLDDGLAVFGGVCLFCKSTDRLNLFSHISSERLAPDLLRLTISVPPLVVGDSGVRTPTARMVEKVLRLKEQDPALVEAIFDEMEGCLIRGLAALQAQDMVGLGEALNLCHTALKTLSLSCEEVERLVATARSVGAFGAKMTGGGGGGCVIALAPGFEDKVMAAWAKEGFNAFVVGPWREVTR